MGHEVKRHEQAFTFLLQLSNTCLYLRQVVYALSLLYIVYPTPSLQQQRTNRSMHEENDAKSTEHWAIRSDDASGDCSMGEMVTLAGRQGLDEELDPEGGLGTVT